MFELFQIPFFEFFIPLLSVKEINFLSNKASWLEHNNKPLCTSRRSSLVEVLQGLIWLTIKRRGLYTPHSAHFDSRWSNNFLNLSCPIPALINRSFSVYSIGRLSTRLISSSSSWISSWNFSWNSCSSFSAIGIFVKVALLFSKRKR